MHKIQKKLLKLITDTPVRGKKLREIGLLVGVKHPQKVKHHLTQLQKKGLIDADWERKTFKRIKVGAAGKLDLVNIPLYGAANCGEASFFADENIEGYLKVSEDLLTSEVKTHLNKIFALKAVGASMNQADIKGNSVSEGDFVVVARSDERPQSGDFVIAVIDNCANIKQFIIDKEHNQIALVSKSTEEYPPIYIHPNADFRVCGKVKQVIKKPLG